MGAPVASARPLPTTPVPPESARLPSTRAVKGPPERAVMPPLRVQLRNSRAVHPRPRSPVPGWSNGEVNV